MVLQYLHIPFQYEHLINLFETRYFGASFSKLTKLETLGLFVTVDEWGDISSIDQYLQAGLPILANVNTGELTSYWTDETSHVVLIIGLDENWVHVNDPAFDDAPSVFQ